MFFYRDLLKDRLLLLNMQPELVNSRETADSTHMI